MNRDAAQLRDEIRLREASLHDAARERDAGELTADQFDDDPTARGRRAGSGAQRTRRTDRQRRRDAGPTHGFDERGGWSWRRSVSRWC